MTWLQKTKQTLEKQRAEQEARERVRRLAEEKRLDELRKQKKLQQQKMERLKAKWKELEIDEILEETRNIVLPEIILQPWDTAFPTFISELDSGDDCLIKAVYHFQRSYVMGHWSRDDYHEDSWIRGGKITDFAIRLYEDRIAINDEEFSLDEIPDAEALQEKIDQYLAKNL